MPRHNTVRNRRRSTIAPRAHLCVESLESRLVPYSVSGNAWPHAQLVTLSFVPDGTNVGGSSNLFASFNSRWATSTWQTQILRAAQVWAQQANLNFAVIGDSGAVIGSGSYEQGDPTMGDIRIGGYNFNASTLAAGYLPPPANNYSVAGDIQFNTGQAFNIGSTYDLFTVAVHEFGHALGLYHSSLSTADMYGAYTTNKTALTSDDIAGIQAIYGARRADAYDAAGGDNSFSTAADITSQISSTSLTALVNNLDITTTSDVDYYTFTAPTGTNGTLSVQVQSSGLSLLSPTLTVYAADQSTVLASVCGSGQYGATLKATINGITAGQRFYVKVAGATGSAFGTGAYALGLSFGANAAPTAASPNTQTLAGSTPSSTGGQANDTFIPNTVVTTTTFNVVGSLAMSVATPDEAGGENHDGFGPGTATTSVASGQINVVTGPPVASRSATPVVGAALFSGGSCAVPVSQIPTGFSTAIVPTMATQKTSGMAPGQIMTWTTPKGAGVNDQLDSSESEGKQAGPTGPMDTTAPVVEPASSVAPVEEKAAPGASDPLLHWEKATETIATDAVLLPILAGPEQRTTTLAGEEENSDWLAAGSVAVLLGAAGLVPLDERRLRRAARRIRPHTRECRRATRYPCWLRSVCRPFGASLLERRASIVRDLSTGGVNLMMDRSLEKGTALAVELEGERGRPGRYLLAHVAYVIEDLEGRWLAGCAFDRSLSEEEVRALLLGCASATASLDFPLWPSGMVGGGLERQ
jgi:hypothetical protein